MWRQLPRACTIQGGGVCQQQYQLGRLAFMLGLLLIVLMAIGLISVMVGMILIVCIALLLMALNRHCN